MYPNQDPSSARAYYPASPPESPGAREASIWLLVAAGFMVLAAIVLWEAPHIFFSVSLSTAHSVCTSSLGVLAQGLSQRVQSDCGNLGSGVTGVLVLGIAGLVLAAIGGVRLVRR